MLKDMWPNRWELGVVLAQKLDLAKPDPARKSDPNPPENFWVLHTIFLTQT